MPIYQYRCPECGAVRDGFNRISERRTNAPACHGPMDIQLTPVLGYVQPDCHYICPVTRKPVTSNRQRHRIMAEHDLVDANDFKPEAMFAKAEAEKARDDALIAQLKKDYPLPESQMHGLLPIEGEA